MQIVIDIPESIYETIKEEEVGNVVYKAIKNGTPLTKGHGRLKDVDALYNDLIFPNEQFSMAFKEILDDADTIIEEDKS